MPTSLKIPTVLLLLLSLLIPLSGRARAAEPPSLAVPELLEAAVQEGRLDRDSANLYLAYALTGDPAFPEEYVSHVPWSGTLPLLRLREAADQIVDAGKRARVEEMLAGICFISALPGVFVVNSEHFHVEYNAILSGLTIDDYVESLETSWVREIDEFGWAAPPVLPSNPPPGDRYHVKIDILGPGLYGFVSNTGTHAGSVGDNPNTPWNDQDASASCMGLNLDYGPPFPGSPQQALDATTAHEFNHSIQFGYGATTGGNSPDDSFIEGGATWMEEEIYDGANDNYNYLWPDFEQCMGEYTASPYPYWIAYHGLTERYGVGVSGGGEQVMHDFWESVSQSASNIQLDALNGALVNKGTTLADAFHAYAISVKYNAPCGGDYTYPYCFEEGPAYVANAGETAVQGTIGTVGGSYSGSVQNNYTLNWVALPANAGVYELSVANTATGGDLQATITCDTGTTINYVPVSASLTGGSAATMTFDSTGCNSAVAVITNNEQTSPNPAACTAHGYTVSTAAATALPGIRVSNPSIVEGDSGSTSLQFLVTLSEPSSQPVTISYDTQSDTATEGADYLRAQGSLDLGAGNTEALVSVPVLGDGVVEREEQFFLNLSSPTNAVFADAQGVGRIADNDTAPTAVALSTLGSDGTSLPLAALALASVAGLALLALKRRR